MKQVMKALAGAGAVAALGLVAASPASANSGVEVEKVGTDLVITGSILSDEIYLDSIGEHEYSVTIPRPGGDWEIHNAYGVTGDVTITPRGGNDKVKIGTNSPTVFSGSLNLEPGGSEDIIELHQTTIEEDLNITGIGATNSLNKVKVHDSHVGGDVDARSPFGNLQVIVWDSVVEGEHGVKATGDGNISTAVRRATLGSVKVTGSDRRDTFSAKSSALGRNPSINLGDGDDLMVIGGDSSWTGRLKHQAGKGDDRVLFSDLVTDGVPITEVLLGSFSISLGPGDDTAQVHVPLTFRGTVNGQGGHDRLEGSGHGDPDTKARFVSFEDVEVPLTDAVVVERDGAGMNITVNHPVEGLRIDGYDGSYRIGYRHVGSPIEVAVNIGDITGDVVMTVKVDDVWAKIGSTYPTRFARQLKLNAEGTTNGAFVLTDTTIGTNLLANGDGDRIGVFLEDVIVPGRFEVKATEKVDLTVLDSELGRTKIVGGNGYDQAGFQNSDLGANPKINLNKGVDWLTIHGAVWTGLAKFNMGADDDVFVSIDPTPIPKLRLLMGSGDDVATIKALVGDGQGSRIQGDGGTDRFQGDEGTDKATIKTFEEVTTIPVFP